MRGKMRCLLVASNLWNGHCPLGADCRDLYRGIRCRVVKNPCGTCDSSSTDVLCLLCPRMLYHRTLIKSGQLSALSLL